MQSVALLGSTLAQAADSALIIDEFGVILFASDQACHALKYGAGELRGQSLEFLIPERHRLAHIGHRLRFTDDRRTRPMGAGMDLFALCKDGTERRVDVSLNPVQMGLQRLMIAVIQLR
jgi:PAS domain S-box-containing protein